MFLNKKWPKSKPKLKSSLVRHSHKTTCKLFKLRKIQNKFPFLQERLRELCPQIMRKSISLFQSRNLCQNKPKIPNTKLQNWVFFKMRLHLEPSSEVPYLNRSILEEFSELTIRSEDGHEVKVNHLLLISCAIGESNKLSVKRRTYSTLLVGDYFSRQKDDGQTT